MRDDPDDFVPQAGTGLPSLYSILPNGQATGALPHGTCLLCQPGYYLDNQFAVCHTCSSPCSDCSSTSTCLSCLAGFHTAPSCSSCSSHCQTCTGSLTCTLCSGGYTINMGACVACTPGSCSTCANGYYPSSGVCTACDVACLTCNGAGPLSCPICVAGYLSYSGACLGKCPAPLFSDRVKG